VFVVEHDPEVIKACEWIVDLGPEAGSKGGAVVYNGPTAGIARAASRTGEVLYKDISPNGQPKAASDYFHISNATANNLKNLTVKIPKGLLTCVTGVSGSGKSSLVHECFLPQHPEAVVIDQSPIGRSSRANPLTYTGIFDNIRKEFAAHTGANASLFSFNSAGACPKCNGQGFISYELNFIDAVQSLCDECEGKRYHAEVLGYRYLGKSIADVLNLSVQEALDFFKAPKINQHLRLMQDVGLGYLKLGQTLSSLSGGESQRLKIAAQLQKQSNIFIMDEPTTGLHRSDIETFYRIIKKLVDNGNTVIIIEHNTDIIKRADWIIDMGPEGGHKGGQVLAEGTPQQIKANPKSVTGKYL
jgi:excinuclease UvrABC ATPase subunit